MEKLRVTKRQEAKTEETKGEQTMEGDCPVV